MSNSAEISIGEVVFRPESLDLCDRSGNRIELRNKSSEVLACLAARAGEIVNKSDLMECAWPDTTVTDESLAQCISDIRRAIGDGDQTLLQTFVGKGYCLNAASFQGVKTKRWRIAAVSVLIAMAIAVYWHTQPMTPTKLELALPDKPSIAVLAFDDLSTGDNRNYLSDAIAEGIITDLSRFSELFVIARNSSFSVRDNATDIREIARILGVRYVLEGSQQKNGATLRVTAQLIDAAEGQHLWSQSYDRELDDLFLVQDDIVRRVASTVAGSLIVSEGEKAKTSDISELTSLLHHLKARQYFQEFTQEGTENARRANIAAIDADPTQPYGHVGLAFVYINGYRWGWGELDREDSLAEAEKSAQMALDLAPNLSGSHNVMGFVHMQEGELDRAIARFETALSLNPNSTYAMSNLAEALAYYGRAKEAEEIQVRAMRLDPLHPDWMKWNLAWIQWLGGKCDDALETMHAMSQIIPLAYQSLAVIHICLGQQSQAEEAIAQLLEHYPGYSVADVRKNPNGKYKKRSDVERWLEGLRRAGLPE